MGKLLADITPLRESPAFRRLWVGSAVSAVGSQLTLVAVSLEVYRITGESLYVGLLAVFALVPLVIGGLLGGSIADSHDRRQVALLASTVMWLATGLIALQSWLQLGNVWVLYLLVALQSGAQAINQPARSAILPMLIRTELLPAANALSMMSFGLAMTAGPLLAGVLVAWVGFGWTYTLDFASFAFVLWAVYRLPPLPPSGSPGRPGLRSVVEGFRFLGTRPNLRMTFVIDLVAMVLAQPRALMPAIGAVMIGGGEATVGVLLASSAVGAFLAGLFSGPLGGVRWQGSAVVISVMGWGASMAAFGLVVLLAGRAPDGAVTPGFSRRQCAVRSRALPIPSAASSATPSSRRPHRTTSAGGSRASSSWWWPAVPGSATCWPAAPPGSRPRAGSCCSAAGCASPGPGRRPASSRASAGTTRGTLPPRQPFP